jgi:hypothetical protein
MEGFGSGAGVEGAAAGACAGAEASPAGACAGACCCPKAGRLKTAIRMNRRPPHCFFNVTLLSDLYFQYSHEASSLRRDFTRRLKERPTQFFDRTYPKLFLFFLNGLPITVTRGKIDWIDAKNRRLLRVLRFFAYHLMSAERPLSRAAT